jgi:hypothetical protein
MHAIQPQVSILVVGVEYMLTMMDTPTNAAYVGSSFYAALQQSALPCCCPPIAAAALARKFIKIGPSTIILRYNLQEPTKKIAPKNPFFIIP